MKKLYAISDLHLNHPSNRQALEALGNFGDDWLILAGDIGDTQAQLEIALQSLTPKFAQIVWVPGNHDLWTLPIKDAPQLRGQARYESLVELCHRYGVITPEDPYPVWVAEPGSQPYRLVPLFLLYDYSFRPSHLKTQREALDWAMEQGVMCSDEILLHPDPYVSIAHWCMERCDYTEKRLAQLPRDMPLVMINHFPLREDLARLPRVPRFSLWCGTKRTQDWPTRFGAEVVVTGHLHIRSTTIRDGVRFEEVSLGYPGDWQAGLGVQPYLRQILPA